MDPLDALNPLDGRYRDQVENLASIFSERGLMQHRLKVEGEYLIALSKKPYSVVRPLADKDMGLIRKLYNLSLEDAQIIKDIEKKGYGNIKRTNHDVKAVEYYMREKLKDTSLNDCLEYIHFALTSEDVNNIAYALMLKEGFDNHIVPALERVNIEIDELAKKYKNLPMLARTHGQPASPTTFGKEFKVFSSRLERQLIQLKNSEILVKLNGATGNYNAHQVSYPNIDWIGFTEVFFRRLRGKENKGIYLQPNFVTTQIEPHDTYAEIFDNLKRANTILIDFAGDIWRYISDEWIIQKPVEGEVGSSTMPNKVNPIDFENSEGNNGISNSLCNFFSIKLPISRLQRDISDSTIERNFGIAFGYGLVAYNSLSKGLSKVSINEPKILAELDNHPEVISEAIQTILRREKIPGAYEKLKGLTRGRKITMSNFANFIEQLEIPPNVKRELMSINPKNYTGLASRIVDL